MPLEPGLKEALTKVWGTPPDPANWGGILGWLEQNHPNMYMELWLLDKAADGVLFLDPNHTLSWNIAMAAKAGNPIAKLICDALNGLSPNHCQVVIDS